MELEQPSGDSAAVVDTLDTATPDTSTGDAAEIKFDEDSGLPLDTLAAPVDDDIEEEVDGVKLKGKKEAVERAKAERLMHKDYTQKTQATAEERRTLEAERAAFQQATQTHQQNLREVAQLVAVDEQLAQYASVNWQAWADQDPGAASKAHMAYTQLQTRRGQLLGALTQKQQESRQATEREIATHIAQAESVVAREVKDWSPAKYREMQDYVKAEGMDPEALRRMLINAPISAKIINKAMQLDRLQKQRTAKPPAAPAPPATRLSGSAAVSTKEPAQMSDSEFAAWRRRQIAQRRP